MAVVPSHFQVLTEVVRYQALGKLREIATQVANLRKVKSPEAQKLLKKGKQISLWLQALDYAEYLTQDQINKIKYALVHISGINNFPTAPVLGEVQRPSILIGSGSTTNVTNNYAAGVPFENTDVDIGTETVLSLATSLSNGIVIHYTVSKAGVYRSGILTATWDGTTADCTETSTPDVGGSTNDLVLSVDINSGNFRLRATAASDNWSVRGKYFLIDE